MPNQVSKEIQLTAEGKSITSDAIKVIVTLEVDHMLLLPSRVDKLVLERESRKIAEE
jgi:hypothetical protein